MAGGVAVDTKIKQTRITSHDLIQTNCSIIHSLWLTTPASQRLATGWTIKMKISHEYQPLTAGIFCTPGNVEWEDGVKSMDWWQGWVGMALICYYPATTPDTESVNSSAHNSPLTQWSYLGCQNSDSASSSNFHHLALLVALVSHSSNFHHWPLLALLVALVLH